MAMDSVIHPSNCTVQDVLKTVDHTLREYERASQRFSADVITLQVLPTLGKELNGVRIRLESIDEDEEVLERLRRINIGGASTSCTFLSGLDADMQRIGTRLQHADSDGTRLSKPEVDMYAGAMERYGEVLKVVQKRNLKDIIERIDNEVVRLTEALTMMHSHLSPHSNKNSYAGMIANIDRLRPLRSAYHDSHGTPKPCVELIPEEAVSDISTWLHDSTQPTVFWMYGESRITTTAIARIVAMRAQGKGNLLSSYFLAWTGDAVWHDSADMIPTIMYKVAHFDKDLLARISLAVSAEPDIRAQSVSQQTSVLVQKPFRTYKLPASEPRLVVIDALDTCADIDQEESAEDIAAFISALSSICQHTKILITSRFVQISASLIASPDFPSHRTFHLTTSGSIDVQHHPGFGTYVLGADDKDTLASLKPALAARYNSLGSAPGCLEGTRVDTLGRVHQWCAETSQRFSIYCLAGHAGTGKTTIAKTLCERLVTQGNLWVATFFASRTSAERQDPLQILHNFVHDIASADVIPCRRILASIRSYDDIKQQSLRDQIEGLLRNVLQNLLSDRLLVLVLDALDECSLVNGVKVAELIRELAFALIDLPVKFVITSRIEPRLNQIFDSLPSTMVLLHHLERNEITHDVRLILTHGFQQIVTKHHISTSPWPTEIDINDLVQRTGSLIIFATTVLKFVANDRLSSPERQLQQVLEQTSASESHHPFDAIDELYVSVLETAARPTRDSLKIDIRLCQRLRNLVGTIALLLEPFSILALAKCISVPVEELIRDINALSAVLSVGPDMDKAGSQLVHIFHPSFREFLLERCVDHRFLIQKPVYHLSLAVHWIRTLNVRLIRDICQIRDPTLQNRDRQVSGVPIIGIDVLSDSASYACRFWMFHLVRSCRPELDLLSALTVFASEHLLHWVECLSFMNEVPRAIEGLPAVIEWCEKNVPALIKMDANQEINVYALLQDVLKLLQTYRAVIITHPLQVYYSAQVTMPHCSLISAKPSLLAPCLLSDRKPGWTNPSLVLEGHIGMVFCVAFMPDGSHVASGSDDWSIFIWNARSGQDNGTLQGHSDAVQSIAFSPCGLYIASGSCDSTVRLWNVHNRTEIFRYLGHRGNAVRAVAFSPSGAQILSGSDDRTVRLWDSHSCQGMGRLYGHDGAVQSVAFSSDELRIASGSSDETIRLWDARTGQVIAIMNCSPNIVTSVAFSPDGLYLFSGCLNPMLRCWDAQTGQETNRIHGHTDCITSVAVSPNGAHIASGSYEKTIHLWYTNPEHETLGIAGIECETTEPTHQVTFAAHSMFRDGACDGELHMGSDCVTSIAFSPDGSQLVSGSCDKTVRIWDLKAQNQNSLVTHRRSCVTCLTFSSDGFRIATGAENGSICIWDSLTGQNITEYIGHTRTVYSVAFSSTGSQVASGSDDTSVRVWNAQTGQEIATFLGHNTPVRWVGFSLDGFQIASLAGPVIMTDKLDIALVWNVQTRRVILELRDSFQVLPISSFSITTNDGSEISLQFESRWKASGMTGISGSSISPPSAWSDEGPDSNALSYNKDSGWILYNDFSICWLPADLRGEHYATHRNIFVIASGATHDLTIIDFTPMIELFRQQDII